MRVIKVRDGDRGGRENCCAEAKKSEENEGRKVSKSKRASIQADIELYISISWYLRGNIRSQLYETRKYSKPSGIGYQGDRTLFHYFLFRLCIRYSFIQILFAVEMFTKLCTSSFVKKQQLYNKINRIKLSSRNE